MKFKVNQNFDADNILLIARLGTATESIGKATGFIITVLRMTILISCPKVIENMILTVWQMKIMHENNNLKYKNTIFLFSVNVVYCLQPELIHFRLIHSLATNNIFK